MNQHIDGFKWSITLNEPAMCQKHTVWASRMLKSIHRVRDSRCTTNITELKGSFPFENWDGHHSNLLTFIFTFVSTPMQELDLKLDLFGKVKKMVPQTSHQCNSLQAIDIPDLVVIWYLYIILRSCIKTKGVLWFHNDSWYWYQYATIHTINDSK